MSWREGRLCSSCGKNQDKVRSYLCGSCKRVQEESSKEEAFRELVFKLAEAAVEADLNGVGMSIQKLLEEARGY